MAYKCWIIYGEHQTGTIALLSEFTSGNTVWRAVQALANSSMEVADSETGAPREVDIEDLVILGDSATRLTSVYNGNQKAGFGFLRVLSQG